MNIAALSRRGTTKAAKRTPANLALQAAMKGSKPGRFPVSDKADRTLDGIVFDSKKEARRYAELRLLERAGEILCLETQVPLNVAIKGDHFCRFTVDFRYRDRATGLTIHEEVKSSGTAKDDAYRLRRKAAELFHGIEIAEVVL